MVHLPHEFLSEASQLEQLVPGDVLLTGTPGGVALRTPPAIVQRISALLPEHRRWQLFVRSQLRNRQYLQPGDVVEATIGTDDVPGIDLGRQRNVVVAARS